MQSWITADSQREAPLTWLGALFICLMAAIAYRPLWEDPGTVDMDHVVFLPGRLPVALVVGVAVWLLWLRRERMITVPPRTPSVLALSLALAAIGLALFVWSSLTGKTDLLLPSLGFHGLALATALAGHSGVRAGLLPGFVLLLGVQIPKPLEDEIVWKLQTWTALGAGLILETAGQNFVQSGVILSNEEHIFHVIDSCSGLNGILVLLVVAVIVQELFCGTPFRKTPAWRRLLIVAFAVPLAFVLNLMRVAYIAASPEPEKLAGVEGDHTLQGLAILMTGTLILYLLGWGLADWRNPATGHAEKRRSECKQCDHDGGMERVRTDGEEERPPEPGSSIQADDGSSRAIVSFKGITFPSRVRLWPPASCGTVRRWSVVALLWLAGLGALSALLPRFEPPELVARHVVFDFPEEKAGWTSRSAPHDMMFTGVFSRAVHRRYERQRAPGRAPDIVDLLIGFEDVTRPSATRLLSSKASLPGPEWEIERRRAVRIWLLNRPAELALSSRRPGGEAALSYTWRVRDRGLGRESLRALLALDLSPWRRSRPRAVVRLVAYAPHGGQRALDLTRQRLDRFIQTFREALDGP